MIDFDALRPKCRLCSAPSGKLDREDRCPACQPLTNDAIIAAAAELAGVPVPTPKPRHGGRRVPSESVFSTATMERLYLSGMTFQDIATVLGCTAPTVSAHIRRMGHQGRMGRARRVACKRGHNLETYGRPRAGGGRYCTECERMRRAGTLDQEASHVG